MRPFSICELICELVSIKNLTTISSNMQVHYLTAAYEWESCLLNLESVDDGKYRVSSAVNGEPPLNLTRYYGHAMLNVTRKYGQCYPTERDHDQDQHG